MFFLVLYLNFNVGNKVYCNERFHYCIEYPSGFVGQSESLSGDGQRFISSDQQALITTYGFLVQNLSDFQVNLETSYFEILKTKNVTYKVKKKDFFIASGYEADGRIFYKKFIKRKVNSTTSQENIIVLEIVYPKSQLKNYAEYCQVISKSL